MMVGTLASAVFAAIAANTAKESLKETRDSNAAENIRWRQEQTLKDYGRLETDAISKLYDFKKTDIDDIKGDIGSKRNKEIAHYLELCELFAVGVEEGVYDKAILSKLELKHLYREFIKLYPFIIAKRKISHDNDYEHLEMLMQSLGARYPYMQKELKRLEDE